MDEVKNFPTMIIPNGTDISVNENGQLAIRTPGNLTGGGLVLCSRRADGVARPRSDHHP